MYEKKIFCTVLVECKMKKLKNSSLKEQSSARVQLKIRSCSLFGYSLYANQNLVMLGAFAEKLLLKRRTASPE